MGSKLSRLVRIKTSSNREEFFETSSDKFNIKVSDYYVESSNHSQNNFSKSNNENDPSYGEDVVITSKQLNRECDSRSTAEPMLLKNDDEKEFDPFLSYGIDFMPTVDRKRLQRSNKLKCKPSYIRVDDLNWTASYCKLCRQNDMNVVKKNSVSAYNENGFAKSYLRDQCIEEESLDVSQLKCTSTPNKQCKNYRKNNFTAESNYQDTNIDNINFSKCIPESSKSASVRKEYAFNFSDMESEAIAQDKYEDRSIMDLQNLRKSPSLQHNRNYKCDTLNETFNERLSKPAVICNYMKTRSEFESQDADSDRISASKRNNDWKINANYFYNYQHNKFSPDDVKLSDSASFTGQHQDGNVKRGYAPKFSSINYPVVYETKHRNFSHKPINFEAIDDKTFSVCSVEGEPRNSVKVFSEDDKHMTRFISIDSLADDNLFSSSPIIVKDFDKHKNIGNESLNKCIQSNNFKPNISLNLSSPTHIQKNRTESTDNTNKIFESPFTSLNYCDKSLITIEETNDSTTQLFDMTDIYKENTETSFQNEQNTVEECLSYSESNLSQYFTSSEADIMDIIYEDNNMPSRMPEIKGPKVTFGDTKSDHTEFQNTDEDNMPGNWKNYREYPFANLVLSGGGSKGYAYIGALKALEDCGVLSRIKRFAGSSAGAICAGLLAVGCSPQDIADVFKVNIKWLFQDHRCATLCCLPRSWRKFYGIYPAKRFYHIYGQHIEKKVGDPDITFHELLDKYNRELCIVVTNVSRMCSEYCNPYTSPDLPIRDAVRISMSFPVLYQAVRCSLAGGPECLYTDGGLLDQYPIHAFDKRDSNAEEAKSVQAVNKETLGLYLVAEKPIDYKIWQTLFNREIPYKPQYVPNTKLARDEFRDVPYSTIVKISKVTQSLLIVATSAAEKEQSDESTRSGRFGLRLFGGRRRRNQKKEEESSEKGRFVDVDVLHRTCSLADEREEMPRESMSRIEIRNFSQYFITAIETLLISQRKIHVKPNDVERTVGINCGYIGSNDYRLEPDDRRFMIDQGYSCIRRFLKEFIKREHLRKHKSEKLPETTELHEGGFVLEGDFAGSGVLDRGHEARGVGEGRVVVEREQRGPRGGILKGISLGDERVTESPYQCTSCESEASYVTALDCEVPSTADLQNCSTVSV